MSGVDEFTGGELHGPEIRIALGNTGVDRVWVIEFSANDPTFFIIWDCPGPAGHIY